MMIVVFIFTSPQEKDAALSDDYGKDLASVQALQRKHEGFEVNKNQCRMQHNHEHLFLHLSEILLL